MKKTIPTNIARTLFYVEEDAYQKLDAYLSDIRNYFASYEDSKEIIEDIESRIQEQLIELGAKDKMDRIVTDAHIDVLIKTMGRPQEFGTDEKIEGQPKEGNAQGLPRKKLYRDKENAVIGGVAAGLGLYFGIDPIIIRILFFISIFFGGLGVVAYIFLWFAVPEAKTATEKIEMEGNPVTLNEVKKIVEEKIEEVGGKDGLRKGSERFRQSIVGIVRRFFEVFGKVIGLILKIIALFGTIGLVTILIITVTNSPLSLLGIGGISLFTLYGGIGILFVLVLIPFLFLGLGGNLLSNPKKSSHKTLAGILALIWIIACIAGSVMAFHIVKNRDMYAQAFEEGETITQAPVTGDFSKLIIKNSQNVRIVKGPATKVEIHGRERDISRIRFENNAGTLSITKKHNFGDCFFCDMRRPEIVITTPALESLTAENGSYASFEGTTDSLKVVIANGSKITLAGQAKSAGIEIKNASSLHAQDLVVATMDIDMENGSQAEVNVTETITGDLSNGSRLEQYGTASLEELDLENGSRADTR